MTTADRQKWNNPRFCSWHRPTWKDIPFLSAEQWWLFCGMLVAHTWRRSCFSDGMSRFSNILDRYRPSSFV